MFMLPHLPQVWCGKVWKGVEKYPVSAPPHHNAIYSVVWRCCGTLRKQGVEDLT